MYDLRWIREHPEEFDRGLARRGLPLQGVEIIALDRSWRAAETLAQEAQARRNRTEKEIRTFLSDVAKARGKEYEMLFHKGVEERATQTAAAAEAARLRAEIDEILAGLPNLPA